MTKELSSTEPTQPSGTRWYKDLDITPYGEPVGIDELSLKPTTSKAYRIVRKEGVIERVDVFENGVKIHYKKFGYDSKGRVVKNTMYTLNSGEWKVTDDIWYYTYHPQQGHRTAKLMVFPGASIGRERRYDKQGNLLEEVGISLENSAREAYE